MIKKTLEIAIIISFFVQINFAQNTTSIINNKVVKIGLLISDTNFVEAKRASQMAIDIANKKGTNGVQFQLVVKSMEGSWGTGSKQVVDLIFKDNVWAILGSLSGQNGHLVEMTVAKTHTIFLSAWASDPTLSEAFVPWYFSCVPNDNEQSAAFIKDIFSDNKGSRIGLLAATDYDSKIAANCFINALKKVGKSVIAQLNYEDSENDFTKLLHQLDSKNCTTIVVFGKPEASTTLIEKIKQRKMKQTVYVSLSTLGENKFTATKQIYFEGVKTVNFKNNQSFKRIDFNNAYSKKYGEFPGETATFAFDGMNTIIAAIKKSGLNRDKLQKTMATINYEGVTGNIQFDANGNRLSEINVLVKKKEIPILNKK